MASPAVASVLVGSRMLSSLTAEAPGVVALDYNSGTTQTFSGNGWWSSGTATDTSIAADESLILDHRGATTPDPATPWWDTAWAQRRCFAISNPGAAASEAPVELDLDLADLIAAGSMQSDGADLRAVDGAGNELPLWIAGATTTNNASIWAQLATAPSGASTVCLYFDNPTATAVSDEASVFSYSTAKLRYYTLTGTYTGSGTAGQVSIVPYADGTSVTVGATTLTGDRGDVLTFSGVNRHSVITSTGAISGRGGGQATDAIIPESYADTEFIFPTSRGVNRLSVRAPFGTVTLEILAGGVTTTQTIAPADGSVDIVADAPDNNPNGTVGSVAVRSTNGTPFLAAHNAGNVDAIIGVPFTGEDMFGIRSRHLRVGAGFANATYSLLGSNGTNLVGEALDAGQARNYIDNSEAYGAGSAFRLTPLTSRTMAIQQADSNGSESTVFIPESLLDHQYFTVRSVDYVAVACPIPGQTVTATTSGGAATTATCANPGGLAGAPGAALFGALPAGTLISSDRPFMMYAEDAALNDEANVVGPLAGRVPAEMSISAGGGLVEGLYRSAGTWASPSIDTATTDIYGFFGAVADQPAGTTVRFQVATGNTASEADTATPVGPDGTAATFYEPGDTTASAAHDGQPFLRFVVSMTTADPLVTPALQSLSLTNDLSEFATSSAGTITIPVSGGPTATTHLLARLAVDNGRDHELDIRYLGGTGLPDANALAVDTDHPARHVEASAGAIVTAAGPTLASPADSSFALFLEESITTGSTVSLQIRVTFTDVDGAVLEKDIEFLIQG